MEGKKKCRVCRQYKILSSFFVKEGCNKKKDNICINCKRQQILLEEKKKSLILHFD